jgi:hypothetical protein
MACQMWLPLKGCVPEIGTSAELALRADRGVAVLPAAPHPASGYAHLHMGFSCTP